MFFFYFARASPAEIGAKSYVLYRFGIHHFVASRHRKPTVFTKPFFSFGSE